MQTTDDTPPTAATAATIRTACWTIQTIWPDTLPEHPPPRPTNDSGGHTAPGSRPPAPIGVLSLRRHTTETLTSYTTLIRRQRLTATGARLPGHGLTTTDTPGLARFLSRHAEWLAHHDQGPTIAASLARIAGDLEWVAAPEQADRRYVGPCRTDSCGVDLYAAPNATTITCRLCHATEDVETRRAFLTNAARDRLLTASDMCRALPALIGERLTPSRLAMWKARGRLIPHGTTPDGRDLFLVADVLDLIPAQAAQNAAVARIPRQRRPAP